MSIAPSKYKWDLNTLRYRDTQTGRYVEPSRVFESYQRAVRTTQARLGRLAERWQMNLVTDEQFVAKFRQELKSLHVAGAILANGGLAQMTPQRWGEVGANLKKEFGYLDRFVTKVQAGEIPKDSNRIISRSRSYTANARLTFWNTVMDRYAESGMIVNVMRKLGPVKTEHCTGCVGAANIWYTLKDCPQIGVFSCMWFCQCKLVFSRKAQPSLSESQSEELLQEVTEQAASDDGLLSLDLSQRERVVLDKIVRNPDELLGINKHEADLAQKINDLGTLTKEKLNGRALYRFSSPAPVPAPQPVLELAPPAIPTPRTTLTRRELEVFREIVTAGNPVQMTDLSPSDARIAKRLVDRGELTRINLAGRPAFRLNTSYTQPPGPKL